MCAAAHGWAGLGRIVYAHSSAQLTDWLAELDVPRSPVRGLAIQDVVPGLTVQGPVLALAGRMRELHRDFHTAARRARS
jgi:tRNA(Arg) A34 adenosine deaminase TadA